MKPVTLLFLFYCLNAAAFVIPDSLVTDWKSPGSDMYKISGTPVVNILDHGGKNDSSRSNNTALRTAINTLGASGGTIYFPAGKYYFDSTIQINRDRIILSGAGADSTRFYFNLNTRDNHCIQSGGSTTATKTNLTATAAKDSRSFRVLSTAGFSTGDWIFVKQNDSTFFTSDWSYGKFIQIVQIDSIDGNRIVLNKPLRHTFFLSLAPSIQKINPRKHIGIECIKITRLDQPTTGQACIIYLQYAVNSWIKGIESEKCFFAHICLEYCSNISVLNSYFHDAFNYGGGGRAYGCAIQFGSSNNLIQNNVFKHLRHSILLQSAPNGNVIGYNYMTDPFWSEPLLPSNSAGQIVLHGNYPFTNLFEGNIVDNLVIDDSHGLNGPYNTFFRNRFNVYGIFMNNGIANKTNFIANENTGILYSFTGSNNFLYGNNNKGSISPSNITSLPDTSYYLASLPADFWTLPASLPTIGFPATYNTGNIPARSRYTSTPLTPFTCDYSCTPEKPVLNMQSVYQIFAGDTIRIPSPPAEQLHWTYSGEHITVEFLADSILILTNSSTTTGILSFVNSNICGNSPAQTSIVTINTIPTAVTAQKSVPLSIYPNPVSGFLYIQQQSRIQISYRLINLLGEEIIAGESSDKKTEIDLSNEKCGVYYLLIKESLSGKRYSYKIIRQ